MILEMIRHHSVVDVFYAAKTLRNSKPNMVETMVRKEELLCLGIIDIHKIQPKQILYMGFILLLSHTIAAVLYWSLLHSVLLSGGAVFVFRSSTGSAMTWLWST